jgi:hypothetical protein
MGNFATDAQCVQLKTLPYHSLPDNTSSRLFPRTEQPALGSRVRLHSLRNVNKMASTGTEGNGISSVLATGRSSRMALSSELCALECYGPLHVHVTQPQRFVITLRYVTLHPYTGCKLKRYFVLSPQCEPQRARTNILEMKEPHGRKEETRISIITTLESGLVFIQTLLLFAPFSIQKQQAACKDRTSDKRPSCCANSTPTTYKQTRYEA